MSNYGATQASHLGASQCKAHGWDAERHFTSGLPCSRPDNIIKLCPKNEIGQFSREAVLISSYSSFLSPASEEEAWFLKIMTRNLMRFYKRCTQVNSAQSFQRISHRKGRSSKMQCQRGYTQWTQRLLMHPLYLTYSIWRDMFGYIGIQ